MRVLARLLLSIMFILGGFSKLTDIAGTAGWFGGERTVRRSADRHPDPATPARAARST